MDIVQLPRKIQDIHYLLRALDWHAQEDDVDHELHARLVIVGPVNSGKSTLFNRLHGRHVSATSAVPGTTKGVVDHPLGPFILVDTPGFGEVWGVDRAHVAEEAAAEADLILLLLDAVAGVRQSDHDLHRALRRHGVPVIVALNKIDLVRHDLPWILENTETLLGVRPIPISARSGAGIVDKLLPAIVAARPAVAVAMAHSLPAVRRHLVNRIIRQSAWINALIALQPIPGLDIPMLLASQTRLILRVAAAYGYPMNVSHARELLTGMAGSLLARYVAGQLAKFVPGLGWLVSSALAAMSTWGIGQAARYYFESGATLKGPDLRRMYQHMRKLAPRHLLASSTLDEAATLVGDPESH